MVKFETKEFADRRQASLFFNNCINIYKKEIDSHPAQALMYNEK
jgi:hypothetical protein